MRRFPLILTLTAWLFATGSHWDLIQVFAWGRMFVVYLQTDTLEDSLASTFDAEKPCKICLAVAAGKQKQEQERAGVNGVKKITLVLQKNVDAKIFADLRGEIWDVSDVRTPTLDLPAPPTPPPRVSFV